MVFCWGGNISTACVRGHSPDLLSAELQSVAQQAQHPETHCSFMAPLPPDHVNVSRPGARAAKVPKRTEATPAAVPVQPSQVETKFNENI